MNEEKEEILEDEALEDDGSGVTLTPEDIFASWKTNESDNHKKSKRWFLIAGISFVALLVYAFFTSNFSFAIIIILIAIIIIVKGNQEVNILNVYMTHKGVKVGKRFHDFDKLKKFAVIYKPDLNKKMLIFEFKNALHPEMIIPLEDANPVLVRDNLLKYLEEDLEKEDIPMSENLSRLLKL